MNEHLRFISSLFTIALMAAVWFGFLFAFDNPTRRDMGWQPANNVVSNHIDQRPRFRIMPPGNYRPHSGEQYARNHSDHSHEGEVCLLTDRRCNKR